MTASAPPLPALPARQPFRWQPWRELTLAGLMVMDLCWASLWFHGMMLGTANVPDERAFGVLLAALLCAHLSMRILAALPWTPRRRQAAMLALLLAGTLAGVRLLLYDQPGSASFSEVMRRPLDTLYDMRIIVPSEFIAGVFVLAIWWRGVALAQEEASPHVVHGYFRQGLGLLGLYILFALVGANQPPSPLLYVFLFAALLAATAARIHATGTQRGGRSMSFNRRWLGGVMLLAAALVGLGYWATQNQMLTGWVGQIFITIVGILGAAIWLLAGQFFLVLFDAVQRLLARFNFGDALSQAIENLRAAIDGLIASLSQWADQLGLAQFIQSLTPHLRVLLLVGILALLVFGILIWTALRLWGERPPESGDETSESLPANLLSDINAALRRRLEQALHGLGGLGRLRRRLAAERIRLIYAEMLLLCDALGKPRHPALTPLEFLPQLHTLFPNQSAETEAITRAYLEVRYGEVPDTAVQVAAIERAWRSVRSEGRESLHKLHKKAKQ